MDFRITCDANKESGVGEVVGELSGPTRKHFLSRDYGRMIPLPHEQRRIIIIERLECEIPETLNKYDFDNFDRRTFESDLHKWFAIRIA